MPYWLFRPIAWVVFHTIYLICGGLRIEGRKNVPRKGGVLVTPNHISDADPATVGLALPRPCWGMAKEELFEMKVVGTVIRWLHAFPVKRYTADRAALRRAEDLLKSGEAVIVFPEGKLSEDGTLQQLLPGVILIARSAGVPIQPTILIGTNRVVPYGKLWPRPVFKKTIVRFGPVVSVQTLTGGQKGGEALRTGAERLRSIMLALQAGEPYPEFGDAVATGSSADPPAEAEGADA